MTNPQNKPYRVWITESHAYRVDVLAKDPWQAKDHAQSHPEEWLELDGSGATKVEQVLLCEGNDFVPLPELSPVSRTSITPAAELDSPSVHTPGPWYVDGPYQIHIDAGNTTAGMMVMSGEPGSHELSPVARVTGPAFFGHEDECAPELMANARLIAAAPDLLEACKELVVAIENMDDYDHIILNRIIPAIAKAA